ncbi:MAG: P-II family nitrogen regulator [Coriobacteriales bacterium]|nr:P-II family nitrogen regulator [Coriobacteriales bacterium]
MKEICAIIRRDKVPETKAVLEEVGLPSVSIQSVEGRGRQRGDVACQLQDMDQDGQICNALHVPLRPTPSEYALEHTLPKVALFVPKRMLTAIVPDESVEAVIEAIIRINQTGQFGDGKIFISAIEEGRRIRTGELGEEAVA